MVQLGIQLPNFFVHDPLSKDELSHFVRSAEEAGFDAVVAGDHLVWHTPVLDPVVTLSHAAALTENVSLVFGIYLLALRHPIVAAKSVASLAHLAPGRVVLGVGVGGEEPREWLAVGLDKSERGQRTEEAIQVVRRTWEGHPSFDGAYFQVPDAPIAPVPSPTVPIWIGGRSGAAMRRAAEFGDGYMTYNLTPERLQQSFEAVDGHRESASRGTGDFVHGYVLATSLSRDSKTAERNAEAHVRSLYGVDSLNERLRRHLLIGEPAQCIEAVRAYEDVGVDFLVLNPFGPNPQEQLELIAEEVLPSLTRNSTAGVGSDVEDLQ